MLQGKFRFAVDDVFLGDMQAFFGIYLCNGLVQNALQYSWLCGGDNQAGGDDYRSIGDDIEVWIGTQGTVNFQRGIAEERKVALFALDTVECIAIRDFGFHKIPLGEFLPEIRHEGRLRPGNGQGNGF